MSVERIKGEVVFVCDDCDDTLETDTDDFFEAKAFAERENWLITSREGSIVHICPTC